MTANPPELPAELAQASDAALEEWFLARLEQPALPFDALLAILASFQTRGHTEKVEACADLLHDTLSQQRDADKLLTLWSLRAEWRAEDPAFAAVCAAKLGAAFQGQSPMETFLRNAGFDRDLPAPECLRRLRVLYGLKPGALCWENTWGLGSVLDISEFDQQVRIDFEKKKAHRMALAYAAESLKLLPDDHPFARHKRDPAGCADWIRQDPAGVVKALLLSFGPLNAPAIQELMVGRIFPETDWKHFWEAARKQLKDDPRIAFPSKRNEPIRLLERAKAYDVEWLAALAIERDFETILGQVEAWKSETRPANDRPVPPAIQDRLDFIIQGAGRSQTTSRIQALLLADEIGFLDAIRDAPRHIAALFAPGMVVDSVHQLPVTLIRRLLLFLGRRDGAQTATILFQILPELAQTPFNEALDALLGSGMETRVIETLRSLMAAGEATPEMIFWLCRRETLVRQHGIATPGRLALEALNVAENDSITGERLKAKNLLRALLEQDDWLPAAFSAMPELERRQFISRLKRSPAWPVTERHAMLYRLTRKFPELQDLLAEETTAPAAPSRRLTSQRSYHERQLQLHKLITEEIPRNSQDIATARSYGDLRENFEYKSAREMQGILMRRRVELETMLNTIAGTDFEGFPTAAAGMGTSVTLAHADGKNERYIILGEWDSDETRGVISSQSKLAQALNGRKPGERVSIPAESGTTEVIITEVGGLSAEIKAWIRGT